MAGSFTTLTASSTVAFSAGASLGYLWQCSNGATGAGSWVSVGSISTAGALTVSNDTNITATFTGSNTTALFTPVTINLAWANVLSVARGGTNFNGSGLTLGDLLYASSGTGFSRLAGNNSGNTRKFLVSTSSGGVATAPTWDFLTGADLSGVNMNFTAIGFGMSQPTNAYISTTNRAGIAGANYQVSLGGTYTGISSTTSIIDLDITTTHTSTTSTLTTSATLQLTPNTNATSATITSNYGILIGTGTNSGGTVTNSYSIYNNVQTIAATLNAGYYQTGTFTKTADRGQILNDTFSPAAAVTLLAEQLLSTTYNPTGGPYTVAAFYNSYINPTITKTSASVITTTAYYGLSVKPAAISMSGAAHVITDLYNLYSASPAPTLLNSASITRAYSGYFVNPSVGTNNVALYAESLQVGGIVSTATTTATKGLIRAYGLNIATLGSGTLQSLVVTKGNGTALATTDVNGFIYLPAVAGAPTAAPTTYDSNKNAPIVYDTTNKILHIYDYVAAAWNSSFTTGTISVVWSGGTISGINVWYSKNSSRVVTMVISNFGTGAGNSTGTMAVAAGGIPAVYRPVSNSASPAVIVSATVAQAGFITIVTDGSMNFYVGSSANPSGTGAGLYQYQTIQWLGLANV
jgi:hypothetical protein